MRRPPEFWDTHCISCEDRLAEELRGRSPRCEECTREKESGEFSIEPAKIAASHVWPFLADQDYHGGVPGEAVEPEQSLSMATDFAVLRSYFPRRPRRVFRRLSPATTTWPPVEGEPDRKAGLTQVQIRFQGRVGEPGYTLSMITRMLHETGLRWLADKTETSKRNRFIRRNRFLVRGIENRAQGCRAMVPQSKLQKVLDGLHIPATVDDLRRAALELDYPW